MLPLEGVTVVSLEQAVAAPFATRQLADLGARVIKVERPTGDFARGYDTSVKGLASHFVWLNRNKESIALDLKELADRLIMDKLLSTADVFVQNLAPGAAARLGFGAAELTAKHPRLIVCDLSGYGSSGPYRDKKAYDLLIQCETGLVSITGSEAEPAKTGISTADIAGGMYAYSGVLTALYERERTGKGTAFEVSLFDALGEWMGFPYYYAEYGGTAPKRAGARHAAIAPYGPFAAGDGAQVFLGVQNEREWVKFCEQVLGRPELAADPRFDANPKRVENVAELKAVIEAVFAKLSSADIEARLEEVGIANARMRTMAEFAEHPQLAARDRWREVDSPAGPLRTLLPPVTVAGREPRMDPIPEVGQHTSAILAELADVDDAPSD
ncbi:CaiB/BaiF CoA-transferase family protein [Saccharopolyspora shandongensis]|uniref:CaiB/BaiF CoA transferase family protein n=1 Tax=Saccharopolyspora shandongensis TaxID=418495 RepID=UPI0033C6BCED